MGRSVMVPGDAQFTLYIDHQCNEEYQWEELVGDLQWAISNQWPSLKPANQWFGRESRLILESRTVGVALCEYMGCASLSLIPRNAFGSHWIDQIQDQFRILICTMYPGHTMYELGTMSNGESVYRAYEETAHADA